MSSHLASRICLITPILLLAIGLRAGADPMYTITALSNRAPSAPFAAGINNQGQVAGSYYNSNATEIGYIYDSSSGNVTTLNAPSSTTQPSAANPSYTGVNGFNDAGQVVGWQRTPDEANSITTGFLYSGGQYSALPGIPVAINNQGQVVGQVSFANGQMTNDPPGAVSNSTVHSYIDTNGTVKDLGGIGNSISTSVSALNDAGQATGGITWAQGTSGISHVFFYNGQTLQDLGTLGGQLGSGLAINNHGDIVGYSQTATGAFHAFLSQQAGKLIDLGTLPGDNSSGAEGINDKGQIVGSSSGSGSMNSHAFLDQNGSMTDLNNLLPTNSGVTLTDAFRINNAGQILAVGNTNGDNWQRLYLLTPDGDSQPVPPDPLLAPVPEPSTLAIFILGSAVWAGRSFMRRRDGHRTRFLSA